MSDTETRVLVMPATNRETFLNRLVARLKVLPENQWDIAIKPHKTLRSVSQNALAWAVYEQIIERGGEEMRGWEKEDLHEFFLIDFAGADRVEIFGKTKLKPLRRSSKMSKAEFSDYIEHIARFMAKRGVVLDLPEAEAA